MREDAPRVLALLERAKHEHQQEPEEVRGNILGEQCRPNTGF